MMTLATLTIYSPVLFILAVAFTTIILFVMGYYVGCKIGGERGYQRGFRNAKMTKTL